MLRRINIYLSIVPSLQNKKEEAEKILELVNCLPDDVVDELASYLIPIQKQDNQFMVSNLSFIPEIDFKQASTDINTSGSQTAYVSSVTAVIDSGKNNDTNRQWVSNTQVIIENITNYPDRRKNVIQRLKQIYPGLSDIFIVACKNYDECKARSLEINHGAMQLRNVLNQLWGNLLEFTRSKFPNEKGKLSNLQLKKNEDRNILVEILAENDYAKVKLSQSLDLIYSLFCQLSDTQFGKNPLSKDLEKLKSIYNQWLIVIDDVTSILWN